MSFVNTRSALICGNAKETKMEETKREIRNESSLKEK
jgi:hypothetical protein